MTEIMALIETDSGVLSQSSLELLAIGKRLSESSGLPLTACVIGENLGDPAGEVSQMGAKKVYTADNPSLDKPSLDSYIKVISKVAIENKPRILLISQTQLGKELGPYLAGQIRTGVVTNCIDVTVSSSCDDVETTSPVFGGAVISKYKFDTKGTCIIVIQTKVFDPPAKQDNSPGDLIPIEVPNLKDSPRVRVVKKNSLTGPRLEDAEIIVSGGKGLKEKDNYKMIEELAEILGGLPGASRAITDEKWTDESRWIGLTGKTVAPNLYLAIGISGAPQHMAGCSKSRTIVAVNNDKDAGIFRYAKYGIEADCLEFLPVFISKCKEQKNNS